MKLPIPSEAAIIPTQSYKGFRYPVRSLFTIALTTAFFGLSIAGAILGSFNLFVIFGILSGLTPVVSMDAIILTPLLRARQAIKNIQNERKKEKSIASLAAITLGFILGGALGFYFLITMPEFIGTLIGITTVLQALVSFCILPAAAVAACVVISHFAFGRPESLFSPQIEKFLLGAAIVIASAIVLPFLHIAVEAIVLGAITSAFLASVISKKLLRDYYKTKYGHSNADGYELTCDQGGLNKNLATHFIKSKTLNPNFALTEKEIDTARTAALDAQKAVKAQLTRGNKITGSHQQITDALKNIYHAITSIQNESQAQNVVEGILANSIEVLQINTPKNTVNTTITDPKSPYFPLVGEKPQKIAQNPQLSMLYHRQGLESARALLPNKGEALANALAPFKKLNK